MIEIGLTFIIQHSRGVVTIQQVVCGYALSVMNNGRILYFSIKAISSSASVKLVKVLDVSPPLFHQSLLFFQATIFCFENFRRLQNAAVTT